MFFLFIAKREIFEQGPYSIENAHTMLLAFRHTLQAPQNEKY
jgi:hypothetical protein